LRALSLLRDRPVYRAERFAQGLRAAGFDVCSSIPNPKHGDVLLIWNRYGRFDEEARRFEKGGARVVVTENSYLAGMIPGRWHALAIGHHGGAGTWICGGPERWDSLGVELSPFRWVGREVVILGQRNIGEPGIASPLGWAEVTKHKIGGRIRPHPGNEPAKLSLADDLAHASGVMTWASSAALVALMLGVPVWYEMPKWIGATASRPIEEWGRTANRSDRDRLAMFRKLIWAQWRIEEIEDGTAFRHLLGL
jgi:hypothetical protein